MVEHWRRWFVTVRQGIRRRCIGRKNEHQAIERRTVVCHRLRRAFAGLLLVCVSIACQADSSLELLRAIESGNLPLVEEQLWQGANPNSADAAGRTALMYAGINGQTRIMKMLIEKGARVHAVAPGFEGTTPLIAAVIFGDPEAVRLLLNYGADVYHRDRNGRSALSWATQRLKNAPSERILLGEKVPERTVFGDLTFATKADVEEVIRLLKNAGARE